MERENLDTVFLTEMAAAMPITFHQILLIITTTSMDTVEWVAAEAVEVERLDVTNMVVLVNPVQVGLAVVAATAHPDAS